MSDPRPKTRAPRGRLTRRHILAAAAVFVLSFLVYANTLGHDFIWDDFDLIVRNPTLRPLDAGAVKTSFTEGFWPVAHRGGDYYRPLARLSYYLDYSLSERDPGGYHRTNVVSNALVSVAVFVFVTLLFGDGILGFATALLFAVHPAHTENVAWIAGRTDVGATLWMLVSLILYVAFKRGGPAFGARRVVWLALSLASFGAALLFKESAVALPLLIALLETGSARRWFDLFPRSKKPAASAVLVVGSYCAVLAVYLAARHAALGALFSGHSPNAAGFGSAVALPFSIFAGYVLKIIAPFSLNAEYDAPVPASLLDAHALAGVALFSLILWAAWRYRRNPVAALGAGVFVLGLLPALNIVPIGEISAERFLYFPSLGFALILAGIFSPAIAARLSLRRREGAAPRFRVLPAAAAAHTAWVLLFAVVAIGYASRTIARNADWRNEAVFFAKTAAQSPGNARAHFNLGDALRERGDIAGAIRSYERALELRPGYEEALSNLAGVYAQRGEYDRAAALLERASAAMPDNARLARNLGTLYMERKEYARAAAHFEKAIALDPREFAAYLGLGLIRRLEGNAAEARRLLLEAARGGPSTVVAWFQLARLEQDAGNPAEAKKYADIFLSRYERDDALRRQAEAISAGH